MQLFTCCNSGIVSCELTILYLPRTGIRTCFCISRSEIVPELWSVAWKLALCSMVKDFFRLWSCFLKLCYIDFDEIDRWEQVPYLCDLWNSNPTEAGCKISDLPCSNTFNKYYYYYYYVSVYSVYPDSKLLTNLFSSEEAAADASSSRSNELLSLPIFGLVSHKLFGSVLAPNSPEELQKLYTLTTAADAWLKRLDVPLPDYHFFTACRPYSWLW